VRDPPRDGTRGTRRGSRPGARRAPPRDGPSLLTAWQGPPAERERGHATSAAAPAAPRVRAPQPVFAVSQLTVAILPARPPHARRCCRPATGCTSR
jgi:hypothetical protein